MLRKPTKRKLKYLKHYPINQCALYKIGSIKKICDIIGIEKNELNLILKSPPKYRQFVNKESFNHFSLKKSKERQVQEPVGDLRKIHERILDLLKPVEPPDYSHAAVKKRSYRTNAAAHVLSKRIATFDLKNFYGSTKNHLVYNFFLDQLKLPHDIATKLTKLTTFHNSMPTGSPLSPLLSLHAAKPMFDELESLAQGYNLIFTCYIDDLTFSGSTIPKSLSKQIVHIIKRYGYNLSNHKTRIFNESEVKHVTGIIINEERLRAPYSRFMTARRIKLAIDGKASTHNYSKIKLLEKRAGLLGETAYLDPTYKGLAQKAQLDLKTARG
ncbi:RNA-directed DNA polymerase [Bathymodiolus japonicus methanotrophic gill symbiont]|uniref:reverse transcriptase family protein n=1 Tax=Bathymodiolus japonicus methanotrophic gill symbiont TaxID=113269 RepID=UPI001B61F2F1|nr:reverse transcriptase family protein [Bathymodiolus japonicus methanotrophic gill symbiont]GFO73669.1 RNA-directed DNA polymerase [Bathymodiolus japonicus methanotrophic gill symbiont]